MKWLGKRRRDNKVTRGKYLGITKFRIYIKQLLEPGKSLPDHIETKKKVRYDFDIINHKFKTIKKESKSE